MAVQNSSYAFISSSGFLPRLVVTWMLAPIPTMWSSSSACAIPSAAASSSAAGDTSPQLLVAARI
jgi:hypothetical protein